MGYRCTWIATRGRAREDVLARLNMSVTDELSEEVVDPGLYAVDVDGWLVVIGDGSKFMDLVQREQAARLSDGGEALFLFTDDTPMCAEITSFVSGKEAWSVRYDESIELAGSVPEVAKSVIAKANRDFLYDAIADIGRSLVGFRHDQTLGDGEHLPVYLLSAATRSSGARR